MPATPRKILVVALRDLLILLLAAGLGEAAVRMFYPQARRYLFTTTITGGHPIRYNSEGLRDEEFPAARPGGERRVLCLGDSTTFGAGLPAEEAYPKQLERLLNSGAAGGSRWRVINAGGQGASISELTRFLQEKGLGFGPETVVLGFSPTMVSLAGRSSAAAQEARAGQAQPPAITSSLSRAFRRILLNAHLQLQRSHLYVLIDANLRRRLYRWGIIRDRMDAREGALFAYAFDVPGVDRSEVEAAYEVLGRELAECRDLLAEHKIPLIVIGLPSRFRISGNPKDNERGYDLPKIRVEPTERMKALCRALEIPYVDLQKRLVLEREEMRDLYIPGDYAHLNAAGMRAAAEELADFW